LASWLDARAQGGQWLVRIEDVDTPRCVPGMDRIILQQLADCGLHPDLPSVWQSQRSAPYQQALDQLVALDLAYPCTCSRKDIEAALLLRGQSRTRHGEMVYPGTCRPAGAPAPGLIRPAVTFSKTHTAGYAWRLRTDIFRSNQPPAAVLHAQAAIESIANHKLHWNDRRLGPQQQDVPTGVGDFVLKRADGCFTYQLAVVVDDAAQGVTDVVRGEDLADNTARQIFLQQALGLPTPRYLHTPLVLGADGEKLSKQNGARALDTSDPLAALNAAAGLLGLPAGSGSGSVAQALAGWVLAWGEAFGV
jgi:glutamyl-Q tRNA(Asp) synthetase